MNVSKLYPTPKDKVEFHLSDYHRIPKESGCYVLTNYDGDILYIGQSVNICRRFEEHLDDSKKTSITPKGRAFWFYWLLWDRAQLNSLERGWVYDYKTCEGERPIMNSIDAPV